MWAHLARCRSAHCGCHGLLTYPEANASSPLASFSLTSLSYLRIRAVLLVSLFWWVVATAFKSDHPLSRPLQDFAFGHFCRHYVTVVLQLRGKARDQYQQVGEIGELGRA